MKEKAKEVAELLKVLANENRLLILCELAKESQSVGTLLTKLDITQSGISQHLAILKANGILDYNKKAQTIVYSIKDERIYKLLDVIKETYCTEDNENE
ncbi:MAG: metalloregulator ArsR/SmtB family transcription factor [Lachnospiraceae bacterium]